MSNIFKKMGMMTSQLYPFLEDAYPFLEGTAKNESLPKIQNLTTVLLTDT